MVKLSTMTACQLTARNDLEITHTEPSAIRSCSGLMDTFKVHK